MVCKKIIQIMLLLGATTQAQAGFWDSEADPKTWAENTEYYAYAITLADWLQTRQIRDTEGVYEKNDWICGKQPKEDCVARWMMLKLAGIWWLNNVETISYTQKYKINVFYSVLHTDAVLSNLKIGLEIKF